MTASLFRSQDVKEEDEWNILILFLMNNFTMNLNSKTMICTACGIQLLSKFRSTISYCFQSD